MNVIELRTNGKAKVIKVKTINDLMDKVAVYNEHYLGDDFMLGRGYYIIYNDDIGDGVLNESLKKISGEEFIDNCYLVKREVGKRCDDEIVSLSEIDVKLVLDTLRGC